MDIWDDEDLIFSYTIEQAIEDGVLCHPYPKQWPWLLVTQNVHLACKNQEGRTYDQCLIPLLNDCIMQVRSNPREQMWTLEGTVAGVVWVVLNEKGGMTVMTPDEY